MALSTKLELRQGQQLVMTPQLQQAIRLLQLSNVELSSFVESELERNPLLEREEVAPEEGGPTERGSRRGEGEEDGASDWSAAAEASLNGALREEGGAPARANGAEPELAGWAGLRPRTSNTFGGAEARPE